MAEIGSSITSYLDLITGFFLKAFDFIGRLAGGGSTPKLGPISDIFYVVIFIMLIWTAYFAYAIITRKGADGL